MSRWMIGYPQLFWWSLLGKIILGMFSSRSVGIADHSCELCNFGHDWMVDPRRTFYQKPWASRSWTANRRSYDIILPHLNIIQSASVYGGRVAAGTILVLLAWLVVPPHKINPGIGFLWFRKFPTTRWATYFDCIFASSTVSRTSWYGRSSGLHR